VPPRIGTYACPNLGQYGRFNFTTLAFPKQVGDGVQNRWSLDVFPIGHVLDPEGFLKAA
jgi:hypothetical protein